jgi:hypothetical protein
LAWYREFFQKHTFDALRAIRKSFARYPSSFVSNEAVSALPVIEKVRVCG